MEKTTETQSIIITIDVDDFLFDKIQKVTDVGFTAVEINGINQSLLSSALYHFPMLRIGAGNILTTQQLEESYQAGAHFATSPGFLPEIVQTASIYSINYLPGIATLSEAMQAAALGCQHVRPFPANLTFCTLLNKYLPLLRLYPAEIEWGEIDHFLNLPAVAGVSIINPEEKQLNTLSAVVIA